MNSWRFNQPSRPETKSTPRNKGLFLRASENPYSRVSLSKAGYFQPLFRFGGTWPGWPNSIDWAFKDTPRCMDYAASNVKNLQQYVDMHVHGRVNDRILTFLWSCKVIGWFLCACFWLVVTFTSLKFMFTGGFYRKERESCPKTYPPFSWTQFLETLPKN